MRRTLSVALASILCAVVLSSCAQKTDTAGAEQAIRKLDQDFLAAIAAKDSTAVANFYAEDAVLLPPNTPSVTGRDGARAFWGMVVQDPNLSFSFEPTRILVAQAGDMAVDVGTYRIRTTGPNGPIEDVGKYSTTLTKVDNDWKIAVDIFNSDLPVTPAAAAVDTTSGR